MEVEINTWLYNILNAINEIDGFFEEVPKEFLTYKNDTRTRRAVERNFEIIGEATNSMLQKNESIKLSYARQIVSTRNRIIHSYDYVSHEVISGVLTEYLPVLHD
jgi:uncharacterized protein with HEPN domain